MSTLKQRTSTRAGGTSGWLLKLFAALVAVGPLPALLSLSGAFAQEGGYEAVTGAATQTRTDPNPFIIGAYGFIWVVVLVYVISIARGLARARGEIAELRRRVDASGSR